MIQVSEPRCCHRASIPKAGERHRQHAREYAERQVFDFELVRVTTTVTVEYSGQLGPRLSYTVALLHIALIAVPQYWLFPSYFFLQSLPVFCTLRVQFSTHSPVVMKSLLLLHCPSSSKKRRTSGHCRRSRSAAGRKLCSRLLQSRCNLQCG